MIQILCIDASARGDASLSRAMSARLIARLTDARPDIAVTHRDVGRSPLPFITEAWIAAAFTPEASRDATMRDALAESDTLIAEIEAATIIVIATPLYNYGMPAALKAWVDQVVRVGRTFSFDLARGDRPIEPVLAGKTLVLLTAAGEFGYAGGIRAGQDHLTPHITTIAPYLGVAPHAIHHIAIEYQEFHDDRHAASVREADAAIDALAIAMLNGFAGGA